MTDKDKIKTYYTQFDEWGRLDSAEGVLEFDILMEIILHYAPAGTTVLDLGGGPGRYTAALSRAGYNMHLADLSPTLIEIARSKVREYGNAAFIKSIEVADATDLRLYAADSFDTVLLSGPLYHLTTEKEILICLSEVKRVLKPSGRIIAVYIPWLSGVRGVLTRSMSRPAQADAKTLQEVFETGRFHNQSNDGFQEGMYLRTDQIEGYMQASGYRRVAIRSLRGIGNGLEAGILRLKTDNPALYTAMLELIKASASEPSVIESGGHAVYIGEKIG